MPFTRGMFLTQGSNLGHLHCRQNISPAEPPRKPHTDIKYMVCSRWELFKNKLSFFLIQVTLCQLTSLIFFLFSQFLDFKMHSKI